MPTNSVDCERLLAWWESRRFDGMDTQIVQRVAVIGAGTSGLVSIKTCVEEGLEPVCFEKASEIGGTWVFRETNNKDLTGPARSYEGLITNISKEMMAFSDFAFSPDLPPYLTRDQVLLFLESYADKFDLRKYVQLNTEVLEVTKVDDFDKTGRWNVRTQREGEEPQTQTFDAVMVCSGVYSYGHMPDYPGLSEFTGQVMHSSQFSRGSDFKDKTVVIVGSCHSAGDVATLCSDHAKKVVLSLRSGAWVFPRIFEKQPTDLFINQRWKSAVPDWITKPALKMKADSLLDWQNLGLKNHKHPLNQSVMINDLLPNKIMAGRVCVRSGVRRFSGSRVEFTDGLCLDDVDCVVFATGYDIRTPFLDESIMSDDKAKLDLYLHIIPPRLAHHTLAAIDFVSTRGSATITGELQARFAVAVFQKKLRLPTLPVMMRDIEERRNRVFQQYGKHKPLIMPVEYNDQLARAIGVLPSFWALLRDPKLAWGFYFGPAFPPCFRLTGPHAKPELREKFLRSGQDLWHGITMSSVRPGASCSPARTTSRLVFWFLVMACIIGFILAVLI